jgi:hypothetical protein
MHAIQQVIREIKKLGGIENSQEARDLQQLVNDANDHLQTTELLNAQPVPRVTRMQQATGSERQSADREMKQSLPRVSQPKTRDKTSHNEGPPSSRTRSKTTTIRTEDAAAIRTKKHPKCNMRRLSKRIERMENEVHKALAIMDAETGKVLNYRQLMQSQKHKETWSKSSANEFGRLANGVRGRVKGTNTIKFVHRRDVPSKRMKDVTYGKFVCTIRPEKKETH